MAWFRVHEGTPGEAVFRRLARKAQTTPANILAVWLMVNDCGSRARPRGQFAQRWDLDDASEDLGLDRPLILSILEVMEGVFIRGGAIIAWGRDQFVAPADPTGAARARRYREKRVTAAQAAPALGHEPESRASRSRHGEPAPEASKRRDESRSESEAAQGLAGRVTAYNARHATETDIEPPPPPHARTREGNGGGEFGQVTLELGPRNPAQAIAWEPEAPIVEMLERLLIPEGFWRPLIPEFIAYWHLERRHSLALLGSKFIAHCKRERARPKPSRPGGVAVGGGIAASFEGADYQGTPDASLPEFLRR